MTVPGLPGRQLGRRARVSELERTRAIAVEKHIASVFGKLSLEPEAANNRRVLAVLRYFRA